MALQDLDVFRLEDFFVGASLGELRKSVSCSIGLALTIIDLEIVLRELAGPTELSTAQTLCTHDKKLQQRRIKMTEDEKVRGSELQ